MIKALLVDGVKMYRRECFAFKLDASLNLRQEEIDKGFLPDITHSSLPHKVSVKIAQPLRDSTVWFVAWGSYVNSNRICFFFLCFFNIQGEIPGLGSMDIAVIFRPKQFATARAELTVRRPLASNNFPQICSYQCGLWQLNNKTRWLNSLPFFNTDKKWRPDN